MIILAPHPKATSVRLSQMVLAAIPSQMKTKMDGNGGSEPRKTMITLWQYLQL